MDLISTTSVGAGGSASITFSSIPSTYTDLVLVLSCRGTGAGNCFIQLQMNSVTTGYDTKAIRGESSVSSTTGTALGITNNYWIGMTGGSNITANAFTSVNVVIPNYAGSNAKYLLAEYSKETNDTAAYENGEMIGSCTSTAAISSLTLTLLLNGATYAQYSTASLYGILKGSGGATAA